MSGMNGILFLLIALSVGGPKWVFPWWIWVAVILASGVETTGEIWIVNPKKRG